VARARRGGRQGGVRVSGWGVHLGARVVGVNFEMPGKAAARSIREGELVWWQVRRPIGHVESSERDVFPLCAPDHNGQRTGRWGDLGAWSRGRRGGDGVLLLLVSLRSGDSGLLLGRGARRCAELGWCVVGCAVRCAQLGRCRFRAVRRRSARFCIGGAGGVGGVGVVGSRASAVRRRTLSAVMAVTCCWRDRLASRRRAV
jgi:hypothetical protein